MSVEFASYGTIKNKVEERALLYAFGVVDDDDSTDPNWARVRLAAFVLNGNDQMILQLTKGVLIATNVTTEAQAAAVTNAAIDAQLDVIWTNFALAKFGKKPVAP